MAPTIPACGGRVGVGLPSSGLSSASHVVYPIQLQRGVMLESLIWILLMGFFVGQIARRLRAPALIGMVLAGIVLGPQVGNVISPEVLGAATSLRTIAVMVILMKAGLGLDREKLAQQGSVALRLGFLPAACEAIAIAFVAMGLFQFDFATGLLLGCVIGAESPAVIVPGMLRLKSLGWGVEKGIPDAILTGSALSDVLLITSSGSVPEEIVQTAQAYGVAEIIIGKRGHRPLEDVLVRSVSQAVLETSPLPVLVVAADANALMTR